MAAIITNKFRIIQAQQFAASVAANVDTYYVGIGKNTPWTVDTSPEVPTDSFSQMIRDYDDMLALKRITASNVSTAVPSIMWTTGTVYTMFDDQDANLFSSNFYVITDEFNVYKCIYNAAGAASTVKPTGTTPGIFSTADLYQWKYMLTLSAATKNTFPSNNWVPVITLPSSDGSAQWTSQNSSINGAIHTYKVTTGGSGYSVDPAVTVTGDGVGAVAIAHRTGDVVTSITMSVAGTGYTYATVSIAPPSSGVQATGRAIMSPVGGHGKDPVGELGASYILISTTFNTNEGGLITVGNEYRKVTMLKSPLNIGTSVVATAAVLDTTKHITATASSGTFVADEIITQAISGATGRVVDYDSGAKTIRYVEYTGTFDTTHTVTGGTSGATASGTLTLVNGAIVPESGTLFYKDYRLAINRSINQSESISVVLAF